MALRASLKVQGSPDNMTPSSIGPRFHLFPRDPGKDAVQGPPKLSEDCRLRSSRSPRTVLEARGLHLSQRSRGKRWILDIIPRFCRFPIHVTIQKPWHLGSTVFQDTPCSWCRKRGILGVLFSKMPPVRENVASWENCFPRCPLFRNRGILGGLFSKMPPV